MRLEKVTVQFTRKKNLGNYESADGSCMLTAYLEPTDDTNEVMLELWRMARENVKAALHPYITGVTLDELMLGIQIEQSPRNAAEEE